MNDIRWKQRFENFQKAVRLLEEALGRIDDLSMLEKEGTIQRFEFTVELAWKTMKDFLGWSGIEVIPLTPKQIIKEAFAAKIIPDGQLWIDMLETRNRLSHTYDETVFDGALSEINDRFLPAIIKLYTFFKNAQ
jgi:nucleotidyltransferase substrate binding protein (TIGR01987 family)